MHEVDNNFAEEVIGVCVSASSSHRPRSVPMTMMIIKDMFNLIMMLLMMIIKEMFNLIMILLMMIIKEMFNLIMMLMMIIKEMFNLIKMLTILMIKMITMIMTIVITSSDARWLPMGADGVGALEAEMTRVAGNTSIMIIIIIMAIINRSSILIINYLSSPLSP